MEPLAALVALLRPRTVAPKLISGAGAWAARYENVDHAGFGLVLEGACQLRLGKAPPVALARGDFVLVAPNAGFALYSDAKAKPRLLEPSATAGLTELHHGDAGAPDFRMLGGYFSFAAANRDLTAGLLPQLVHITRAASTAPRLVSMIDLIADEAMNQRPGRDFLLDRFVEAMLVETLRGAELAPNAQPGLLAGLSDPRLARALSVMHAEPARHWSVAELAREAGLSRSSFSERFTAAVGAPPMEYLLQWRMALAKDMLQHAPAPLEQIAAAIGYESASAFSTAFRRRIGRPPSHFARASA
ncbi:MAG: AraC family transcriptional regulator [Hyphomonadaceae bacterium]